MPQAPSGSGALKVYAMHPTQAVGPGGQPQYHTTQLKGFDMTSDRDTCAEGMKWFRNSRDLAETQQLRVRMRWQMRRRKHPRQSSLT